MQGIRRSTTAYEHWLRAQLRGDVVAKDLRSKHTKMRESPFAFLRATYWRWAETVLQVCPHLAKGPTVIGVGDIHLENFGTWRDAEGRLIWGVNDFDEAAEMPYALDLVRLAASAVLAHGARGAATADISLALLLGYRQGLDAPAPIVLDRKFRWLGKLVVVSDSQRRDFWKKIARLRPTAAPARYRKLLAAAMPPKSVAMWIARRAAGAGSLGRPRWIAVADWQGGAVVREAKALVPSAWSRAHRNGDPRICCDAIARGRYRAPDPWYTVAGTIAVRRLSPNNRKIEADDPAMLGFSNRLLEAMGRDLASVHLGVVDRRRAILRDLKGRDAGDWLAASTDRMADAVRRDFKAYGGGKGGG